MSRLEAILESTARPLARISPAPSPSGSPTASRLLGDPYFPRGSSLPECPGGQWVLLAQVNFAHLPAGIDPDLPKKGMLQLFFASQSMMGMDWDALGSNGKGYLARWVPEADEAAHDPKAARAFGSAQADIDADELFPLSGSFELAFAPGEQTMLPTDEAAIARDGAIEAAIEALDARDQWHEAESGPFTQVGGYAYFTQSDPRDSGKDWVVLLQLDTDDAFGMMWGDCGVANLSIPRDSLRALDFSEAFFTWDCC